MNKSNSCVLSSGHIYAVAGIRKELYIWSMDNGDLVKCLDAHFARIIDIQPLTVGSWNSVITSSIDRTVKVWNMNYIFEQVHHIDRHELQIDCVSLCTKLGIAVTVTRNCIGIWDLLTGKLRCENANAIVSCTTSFKFTFRSKLADSALGAIVTHAVVTLDGKYILAAESGNVMYWDVAEKVVIFKEEQRDIQQVCKDKGHPWERAKSFDNSAIIGKRMDKNFFNLEALNFKLKLNDEVVQSGNTKDLIFNFDVLIHEVSKYFTLNIGDIIFTGTPAGVGAVKPGDKLTAFLEEELYLNLSIIE